MPASSGRQVASELPAFAYKRCRLSGWFPTRRTLRIVIASPIEREEAVSVMVGGLGLVGASTANPNI